MAERRFSRRSSVDTSGSNLGASSAGLGSAATVAGGGAAAADVGVGAAAGAGAGLGLAEPTAEISVVMVRLFCCVCANICLGYWA